MKINTRIQFLDDNGEKFFGEGPCRLLRAVEEHGSLRGAAASMGMAYTKALKLLGKAEQALGFELTTRTTGGASGGGSRLTEKGAAWLERFEACCDACKEANRRLYREYFPARIGCVIMASGMGRRFGGNKLMTDFRGKPLVRWAMEVTEGIFDRRIVVTRHRDVAELAKTMEMEVILHDYPLRSDAVRLGIEAMGDMDGCLFCPGDQPLLRKETLRAMKEAAARDGDAIIRAAFGDEAGAPVLFPGELFQELRNLPEGRGGGYVLERYPDRIRHVQADAAELMDVDTPEDIHKLLQR